MVVQINGCVTMVARQHAEHPIIESPAGSLARSARLRVVPGGGSLFAKDNTQMVGITKQLRQKQIDAGLCVRCGKGAAPSPLAWCRECRDKHSRCAKARREARKSQGLCTFCGRRPLHNKTMCLICLEVKRNSKARIIAEGRCTVCGGVNNSSAQICSKCSSAKKQGCKALIDCRTRDGDCVVCGTSDNVVPSTLDSRPHCESCIFKRTAHSATGVWGLGPAIAELFESQDRRCAYTGRVLVLGANASLDHKKPRAKHPECRADIGNLQWVDRQINSMKHDLSHDDFLALCREVAK